MGRLQVVLSMRKPKAASRLTMEALRKLEDLGYRYVLIKGYMPDRRADYIELNHFILVPVKALPEGEGEKEIYAPIDSEILRDWANQPDDGIVAFIEGYSSFFNK